MTLIAIVDSGPLVASFNRRDHSHRASLAALEAPEFDLVIPAMVVAEVCYLLQRIDTRYEAAFLDGLAGFEVLAPEPDDWHRIAELVRQYADFPLGGADASVVALAERLNTDTIITLDRRHFGAIRPRHCDSFRLLPE